MRRGEGLLRSQSGQAMLELAIVTPLLLLLSIGVIELGRFAYIGILVGNAARAGADYGAQSLAQSVDTVGIQTAAQNDYNNNGPRVCNPNGTPPVTTSCLTVTSSTACGCDNGGTTTAQTCTVANANSCTAVSKQVWVVTVSVTASGTFSPMFTYPGLPGAIAISRTSTLRVAQV